MNPWKFEKKKWFTCLNETVLQWTSREFASLALGEMFLLLNLPIKTIILHAVSMKIFEWCKWN